VDDPKKRQVFAELYFCLGFLFPAFFLGASAGGYGPSSVEPTVVWGSLAAMLYLRRSWIAKTIGLVVSLTLIAVMLWSLRSRFYLLWDGQFGEFFGW